MSNVSSLKCYDGSLIFDPLYKASILTARFSSGFTFDNHFRKPHQIVNPLTLHLTFTSYITLRKVIKLALFICLTYNMATCFYRYRLLLQIINHCY